MQRKRCVASMARATPTKDFTKQHPSSNHNQLIYMKKLVHFCFDSWRVRTERPRPLFTSIAATLLPHSLSPMSATFREAVYSSEIFLHGFTQDPRIGNIAAFSDNHGLEFKKADVSRCPGKEEACGGRQCPMLVTDRYRGVEAAVRKTPWSRPWAGSDSA